LKIDTPAPHTTSCCFGGKDLRTLYITTAKHELTEEKEKQYPLSGGLFSIDVDVRGVPADFYQGVF